jgi:hypothetical protein
MLKRIINTGIKSLKLNKSIKYFSTSRNNLVNCFKKEIDYEETEYKPISDEEKKVFFKNSGFEFIESSTSSRMELKKTVGEFHVSLVYNARAPMPQDEESQKQQSEENQEPTNLTDCTVIIQKIGKSSGFLVDAMVVDGQFNVNHIYISDNVQEFHTKLVSGKTDPDVYQGPEFSTLDENLQTSFQDFLEELGINDETAAFVEVTAIDKDQSLYINWLKICKNNLI